MIISPAPADLGTNEAFRADVNAGIFPTDFSGTADLGGWMYMNLDNGGSSAYSAGRPVGTSQNWVTVSMAAEGRYNVLFDATRLGNGCSPAPAAGSIGPAPNVTGVTTVAP